MEKSFFFWTHVNGCNTSGWKVDALCKSGENKVGSVVRFQITVLPWQVHLGKNFDPPLSSWSSTTERQCLGSCLWQLSAVLCSQWLVKESNGAMLRESRIVRSEKCKAKMKIIFLLYPKLFQHFFILTIWFFVSLL